MANSPIHVIIASFENFQTYMWFPQKADLIYFIWRVTLLIDINEKLPNDSQWLVIGIEGVQGLILARPELSVVLCLCIYGVKPSDFLG